MAYVATPPWHGLGSQLSRHQPLEVWQHEAGMNWHIEESPVRFVANSGSHLGSIHAFPEQKVLYRSDTEARSRWSPNDTRWYSHGMSWSSTGILLSTLALSWKPLACSRAVASSGALARTGHASVLKGNDQVNGYVLLATSCDGTLATVATPTTVRVVCNNTLAIALNGAPQSIRCLTAPSSSPRM